MRRADAYERRRPRRRRGCTGLLLALIAVGGCGGITAAFVSYLGGEPIEADVRNVRVNATPVNDDTSSTVVINQPLTLEFDLQNQEVSKPEVMITGIGLDQSLTDGLRVDALYVNNVPVNLEPDSRSYPLYGDWDFYKLDREIPKEEALHVRLDVTPIQAGTYAGDLMIWVEGGFLGIPLERAVREPLRINAQANAP